jgi:hypothetical protein
MQNQKYFTSKGWKTEEEIKIKLAEQDRKTKQKASKISKYRLQKQLCIFQ